MFPSGIPVLVIEFDGQNIKLISKDRDKSINDSINPQERIPQNIQKHENGNNTEESGEDILKLIKEYKICNGSEEEKKSTEELNVKEMKDVL